MSDSEPGIRLDGVTKTYGDVTAVRDVDLRIVPGEVHAVVGPNGSGKSTLFALVLGLARPTTGTISRPDERIGCGFQAPSVYPGLSVDENLRVFAAMGDAGEAWVETVRAGLGLDAVRSRVASELSGGYHQLLDLALAFVRRPQFVVLDEPLNNLDEAATGRVLAFVDDYRTDERTVVVSTHRADAFADAVDRLTVMDDGEIVFDGRPDAASDAVRSRLDGPPDSTNEVTGGPGGDSGSPVARDDEHADPE